MILNLNFDLQRFDSAFSGGSGTESDPYKIGTLADLEQLRRDVNGGNGYAGKYLKVTNDIALSDNWAAIGGITNKFRGTFDGDGHTISDFKVYHTNHDLCEGLFGYIEGATIKNVHLTNVNIRSDYYTIGAITAYAGDSQVINCSVQGKMDVGGLGVHVGGLFGRFFSGSIKNCAFLGTFNVIEQSSEVGIIAAFSPRLEDNYYYGDYDNLNPNGATRIYNANVPKGVTSSGIVSYLGKDYVKSDEVTFDYLGGTYKYNVTGDVTVKIEDNKLYANDTELGAVFPNTLKGDGSENNPFIIKTEEHLRSLAAYVNLGNDCAGKNFKLADNITLKGEWTPIGNATNKFKGTFDGDGKTVGNLTISNGGKYQGLFGNVENATIKNVNLTNVDAAGTDNVGSLVGSASGKTQISNCSAQGDVKVTSTNRAYLGGLVGYSSTGVTVDACTFSGSVKAVRSFEAGSYGGGLVGCNNGTIKNSAFLDGSFKCANEGAIAGNNGGTLTDNYYYGDLKGVNDNGAKKIFRVTVPNNVTSSAFITLNGTNYITAGDAAFTYNGNTYNYTVNSDIAVTTEGNNLSFDKVENVENFLSTLDGDGSENKPFLIETEEKLRQLAIYVNYGNNCAGKNFKLANDITLTNEWTPVGNNVRTFRGNFDGDGHTISNLIINDATKNYQGLFGYVNGSTIKNVNLADVNITGRNDVGALVGEATGRTQISNCSASGNLKGSENVGGLVGSNNATIKNSTYLGGTIDGTTKGAIAGNNGGTLTDNYYHGTLADGVNDNKAAQIFNVTFPDKITSSAEFIEISGKKYVKGGNVTFVYNGKNYNYTVNEDVALTIQNNKILVNNTEPQWRFPDNLDGNGSEKNPFLIRTEEHLRQLATYVNNGNRCAGMNFKLANNIALTGEWIPVGTFNKKFSGNFDGNGYTVSGLTIKNGKSADCHGLFGDIEGATIKNVKLTDVDISGYFRTGALVGSANNNAQIINCSAQGNVKSNSFCSFIGGLVGQIATGVTVDGCTFSGNISGIKAPKLAFFGSYVGGVVGFYGDGTIKNSAYLGGSITGTNLGAIMTTTGKSATLIDNYYCGKLAEGVNANGAAQIFNVTLPSNVTSSALVTLNGKKYIKGGEVSFTYGGNNYTYTVNNDIALTIQGNKLYVGGEELKSAPALTAVANENSTLKPSAKIVTFSTSAKTDNGSTLTGGTGNDSLWGSAGKDTFIYNGGNDVICGFGDGDSLKINGFDDIIAAYDNKDNVIKIPCGAGSVTLKDFTTNEFAINNDTWRLSGNTLSKGK